MSPARLSPARSFLLAGGVATLAGCGGENLVDPTTGALEIVTSTSGVEPDPDGYTLRIDAEPPQDVGLAGTVQRTGLAPGDYTIELGGLAPNCTVTGDNPRTVTVARGETATVTFAVACGATTGRITVKSATIGTASDPDGYTITLDGSERGSLEGNGAVTLDALPPGPHTIGLSGLAAICHMESENPQSLEVPLGGTVTAEFRVACLRPPETRPGGSRLPPPLPPSLGEAFFVATSGDDTNPGTIRAPWRSIQKAMDALGPGQVAYVRLGTYETGFPLGSLEDTHTWAAGCSSTAPCSILAFPSERPVLHGQIVFEGEGLRLSGFVIEGPLSDDVASCSGRRANQIDIKASYVEISHNEIRNNDYHAGINVTLGGHVQILSNWIHHNGRFALLTDPCTGNEVFETDHGIYWEAAGDGGGNLVANNLIHDNRAKGMQFSGQITHPVLVVQNTVVENGNAGILVNGSEGGMVIVNNVVAFNGTAAPRSQIRIQQGDGHLIRRNLTFALDSLLPGIENTTASVTEDNLEADPQFVNPDAAAFAVSPGSAAVDAADADYASGYDLEGTSRPQGQSADLGAYER
jgi:parallel beta helix pectate lyase-like protein